MTEPILSWNLLITAIGLPALAWFLKRLLDKKESMEEKTNAIKQAQDMERHHQVMTDMHRMEECLQEIKRRLEKKVDTEDCKERCDDKWEIIYHHKHDDDGKVVVG